MRLGIDFGSTYSALSKYNESTDNAELIHLVESGSPYIPSIVARDGLGRYYYGYSAQNKMVKSSKCKVYKAFKMLINETDEKLLTDRGFDDISPREVAKDFLTSQVREAMNKTGESVVEEMVICAPEVWSKKLGTLDGRSVLREIATGIPNVSKVQVVSEPEAASAFFAYNFQRLEGRPYLGKILLVDYGGGTLDITLTDVSGWTSGTGRNSVEIKVLAQTGAGENHDKRVGNAGIAFMENVVIRALSDAGVIEGEEKPALSNAFIKAVDSLESDLMTNQQNIADAFDLNHKLSKLKKWEAEEGIAGIFCSIEYGEEEVPVFYSHLMASYQEVIEPVLESQLNKIIEYMKKNDIVYDDATRSDFKVELVGGFSNFYLVKKQVEKMFKFSDNDNRRDKSEIEYRESAISLGAGLLAAGVISQKATARYSLGVYSKGTAGKEFAVRAGQDLAYDKVYWQERIPGDRRIYVLYPGSCIDSLVIEFGEGEPANRLPFKDELREIIMHSFKNTVGYLGIGFSFDASGVVSLHTCDYNVTKKHFMEDTHRKIELTDVKSMFDMATLDSVEVNG